MQILVSVSSQCLKALGNIKINYTWCLPLGSSLSREDKKCRQVIIIRETLIDSRKEIESRSPGRPEEGEERYIQAREGFLFQVAFEQIVRR